MHRAGNLFFAGRIDHAANRNVHLGETKLDLLPVFIHGANHVMPKKDIVLREGDRITIPTYNGTVKVDGEVMYPNTVGYKEGKSAKYYINQAGGFNRYAKKNQAYVIYMNGTVAKVSDGAKIRPGCEIVVPQKAMNRKMGITEYLAIGSSAAAIATMGATIGNLLK